MNDNICCICKDEIKDANKAQLHRDNGIIQTLCMNCYIDGMIYACQCAYEFKNKGNKNELDITNTK